MKRTYLTLAALLALGLAAVAGSMIEQPREKLAATKLPASKEKPLVQIPERRAPLAVDAETDAADMLAESTAQGTLSAMPFADGGSGRVQHGAVAVSPEPFLPPPPTLLPQDRERYQDVDFNPVKQVSEAPVSTFSIDVDTASYANIRRFLQEGRRPPVDAVRIEEMINYFDYAYAPPADADQPFATDIALFSSPWDAGTELLRIGIKGYEMARRPRANLVFLVDTSGSMQSPDKLPLLQRSLRLLIEAMAEEDSVAIVAYAGSAGVVLEPTSVAERAKIIRAIDDFRAGGSTAGAEGIRQAYQLAAASFDEVAVNRVILATDGDFNVGISDPDRLEDFIAAQRETGVYLSILGFGRGNLNDLLMQKLAQAGNGNASYIDGLMEARKVLVDEMSATLFAIADDVKIQIEFNPKRVAEYRLIGYETRMLRREDFSNDRIDAGEIGSGHMVTALYEITRPESPSRLLDDLRYGVRPASHERMSGADGEVAWLRLRYKRPGERDSRLIEQPVPAEAATSFEAASSDARFAAAVAGFGQILRQSPHVEAFDLEAVLDIARSARGDDPYGYRSEFLQLVRLAESANVLGAGGG